jgi:retron-type reverse transcriptase
MVTNKPYNISKQTVFEAYKRVKANKGSAGIDRQTIEVFDQNLKKKSVQSMEQNEFWQLFSTSS